MGETSQLSKSSPDSDSLRTTVPIGIVKHFGLKEGETLDWAILARESRLLIEVRPIRSEPVKDEDSSEKASARRKGERQ